MTRRQRHVDRSKRTALEARPNDETRHRKTGNATTPAEHYTPTAEEQAAIDRVVARITKAHATYKLTDQNELTFNHPDLLTAVMVLTDATGSPHPHAVQIDFARLARVIQGSLDKPPLDMINVAVDHVAGIAPKDTIENLLAVQMAACHDAAMWALWRMKRADFLPQVEAFSNMANKMLTRFAGHVDTLKRHRSTGEQRVTVQHVQVAAQNAQVNVGAGEGVAAKDKVQPHAQAITYEPSTPMPCTEQNDGQAVPIARRKGS